LTGGLDRETRDVIQLTVTAVDAGSPQLTGTIGVTINVEDVNDNPPTFPTSAILANVRENLPVGTKIRRISAQVLIKNFRQWQIRHLTVMKTNAVLILSVL
jgi:hypothetical protein